MVDKVPVAQILDGLNSLKGEVTSLKDAVASLSSEITGVKSDVAVLRVDVSGLKTDVAAVKSDVSGLKTDVAVIIGEVVNINGKLDRHEVLLSHLASLPGEIFDVKQDILDIKKDTAKIPELQRLLDITAAANTLDRQERAFMMNRINGHEERLVVVEDKLAIKPPVEVF